MRCLTLLSLLCALPTLAAQPPRPKVDVSAMREAMSTPIDETVAATSPAASYAHYLRSRLAHHDGDHRTAIDELRLALASDAQNLWLMTALAEQYARAGELERAEAQLLKVIEKHPRSHAAQLLLGRVLYEGGRFPRARTHLQRAIKLKPAEPDAYLVLTQVWLDQGRADEAVKVVDELAAALPGEPIGFHRLGLALAEKGDAARAEKLLLRAIERDPGDLEALVVLARIAENDGHLEEASRRWERAVAAAPDNREVLLNAGRVALRMKKVPEAEAYFTEVLAQGHDAELAVKVAFTWLAARQLPQAASVLDRARAAATEPRLHFYAGLVHERARAFGSALDAFSAVPDGLGELSYDARVHRGRVLSLLGRHREALDVLGRVRQEKGEHQGLDVALSRAHELAGQPKEAEAALLAAIGRRPSFEALDALAALYGRLGRHADAVALLSGAQSKAPDDEAVTFALATALERKGDWQQAIGQVRQLLARDARHPGALNFIGYTLATHGGDLDEAEALVRRALLARPDSAAFLDSLGWVLLKKGRLDAALEALNAAIEEGPEDATLYEHLGDVQAKRGDRKRAAEAYRRSLKVLELSPEEAERTSQRRDVEKKLKSL